MTDNNFIDNCKKLAEIFYEIEQHQEKINILRNLRPELYKKIYTELSERLDGKIAVRLNKEIIAVIELDHQNGKVTFVYSEEGATRKLMLDKFDDNNK